MEFEEIYKIFFRDVYLYIRSLAGNEHLAEDITQESFMKALKSIDRFDGQKDIRAWLFTIAKNTYLSRCRKQKHLTGDEIPESFADPDASFETRLEDEETVLRIHRFLHSLKEPYKEVFNLRVFAELSYEKIGAIFGKSEGWARVTFYRTKKMILEHLEVSGDE